MQKNAGELPTWTGFRGSAGLGTRPLLTIIRLPWHSRPWCFSPVSLTQVWMQTPGRWPSVP